MTTAIIYSDEWRQFDYGPEHPLRMERLGLTWRLMEAYGLTALPRAKVWAPERAELEEIARFHSREYIEILRAVSAGDWVPNAAGYGLGPGDNPIFPGLWEAAQLGAGGSLLAARLVAEGRGLLIPGIEELAKEELAGVLRGRQPVLPLLLAADIELEGSVPVRPAPATTGTAPRSSFPRLLRYSGRTSHALSECAPGCSRRWTRPHRRLRWSVLAAGPTG